MVGISERRVLRNIILPVRDKSQTETTVQRTQDFRLHETTKIQDGQSIYRVRASHKQSEK